MGPDQAANTLAMVKDEGHKREGTSWTEEEREAYRAPVRKTFEDFANAYNFARNTWCDMVIDPLETRNVMALVARSCRPPAAAGHRLRRVPDVTTEDIARCSRKS